MAPVAIVVGAGPGLGAAVSRLLGKQGYSVAVLTRSKEGEKIAADINKDGKGEGQAFQVDVTDPKSVADGFAAIKKRFSGPLKVAIFNANNAFLMKSPLDLTVEEYDESFAVNGRGALVFSQHAIRAMLEAGTEKDTATLLLTGATASLRGGAKFAGFSPSKFALRGLGQSLAREYGPQGIHVAHINIDGQIDTDRLKSRMGEAEPGKRLLPDSIASTYWHLILQPRDCWTQELDVRPALEKF